MSQPLDADPRPGTRPLRATALGAFAIQLLDTTGERVVARMPAPSPRERSSVLVLAETAASTAAGLAAGETRRAFGAELDMSLLHDPAGDGWITATATPLAIGRERHVWQIDVVDHDARLLARGRCTLGIVDAPTG